MPIAPVNSNINQVNFNKNRDKKVKTGVIATSALGVATALAHISKRQGFSLNPSKLPKLQLKIGQFLDYIQNNILKEN